MKMLIKISGIVCAAIFGISIALPTLGGVISDDTLYYSGGGNENFSNEATGAGNKIGWTKKVGYTYSSTAVSAASIASGALDTEPIANTVSRERRDNFIGWFGVQLADTATTYLADDFTW